MPNLINLVGRKYNRLTVLSFVGRNKHKQRLYECRCDCGTTLTVVSGNLSEGCTHSCGCYRKEISSENQKKHGECRRTKEYSTWRGMRQRCNDPKNIGFKNYGGRGIKVCDRWNIYQNFIGDMGRAPSKKHSIDRIKNDMDYGPGNCKWATKLEQANNTRRNKMIEYNGEIKSLPDWCRSLNLNYRMVASRIYGYKWTIDRAFKPSLVRQK